MREHISAYIKELNVKNLQKIKPCTTNALRFTTKGFFGLN